MSIPKSNDSLNYIPSGNVLDQFRTWSYHFVMLVANDTGIVDELAGLSDIDIFRHNINGSPDPKKPKAAIPPERKGKFGIRTTKSGKDYVVVINTMTDAEFIIDRVELDYLFAPANDSNAPVTSTNTSMLVDGKIKVTEPFSTRFVEVLVNAGTALGLSTPLNATYILKPIFVGYKDDGTPDTVTNVKPFAFNIIDMAVAFNEAGSSYDLEICAADNGAAYMKQTAQTSGVTFSTKSPTIGGAIAELSRKLNEDQDRLNATNVGILADDGSHPDVVRYNITVDPYFKDFPLDLISKANKTTQSELTINIPTNASIGDAIDRIMQSSSKTTDSMKPTDDKGNKKDAIAYRIDAKKETTPQKGTVHTFNVMKRKLYYPNITGDATNDAAEREKVKTSAKQSGSFLQYDYIFSGKNTDIVEFDMRLNFGGGLILTYNVPDPVKDSGATTKYDTVKKVTSSKPKLDPKNKPTVGIKKTAPSVGVVNNQTYASFQQYLKTYATCDLLDASIKIKGDPRLMGGLSGDSSSGFSIDNLKGNPGIVQLNLYMPPIDPDTGMPDLVTGTGKQPTFRQSFWFDGLFQIFEVVSVFENGEFVQTLTLQQLQTLESAPTTSDTSTGGMNAYADIPGMTVGAYLNNLAAHKHPSKTEEQRRKIQEGNINIAKQIASAAPNKYTPPAEILCGIATVESGLGIHQGAINSHHTAAGVCQFVVKTTRSTLALYPDVCHQYFGGKSVNQLSNTTLISVMINNPKLGFQLTRCLFEDNVKKIDQLTGYKLSRDELILRGILAHNVGFSNYDGVNWIGVLTRPGHLTADHQGYVKSVVYWSKYPGTLDCLKTGKLKMMVPK